MDVAFRRAGDDYELCVQDNGVGAASGAGPKGTGLGRQIVQQFAEQLCGRFEMRSDEHGLRAALTFPVQQAAPET
ncbi:MAG TPA: hypothetical protein VGE72_11085 [Azospirillum sp.]